jgi:signal transduction histidine kinase
VFRQIRSKLLAAFAVPLAVLVAVAGLAISSTLSQTRTAKDEREAVALAAVGLAGALLGLVLVIRVSRAVSRPLADLANQAEHLATVSLPATVQALLDADATGGELPEVPKVRVGNIEEVAGVATALEALNKTAVELASGQAALRRNLSDAFVNLGRRNQNLVTRQLEYITEIELKEADPTSLEELFRLDHLATRMRRNAESLLILAGSGPARPWNASVPVMDVARAASAEVEDYKRLRLHHFDPAMVTGIVTTDLVHVLAELVENALSFSPPGALVDVYGRFLEGAYVIVIVDSGIGMSSEDLTTANQRLEGQGANGEVPGRYLGHFVAGRLAARHGISISLQPSHSGGLVARVRVPASLMDEPVADLSAGAEVRPAPAATSIAPATKPDEPGPTVAPTSPPPLSEAMLELAASLAAATPVAEGPTPEPVEPVANGANVFEPEGEYGENAGAYEDEPAYENEMSLDGGREVAQLNHDADDGPGTMAGHGAKDLGAVWLAKFPGPSQDIAETGSGANGAEVGTEAEDTQFVKPFDWSLPAETAATASAAEVGAQAEAFEPEPFEPEPFEPVDCLREGDFVPGADAFLPVETISAAEGILPRRGWDPLPVSRVENTSPVKVLPFAAGETAAIVTGTPLPATPDLAASGPLAGPLGSSGGHHFRPHNEPFEATPPAPAGAIRDQTAGRASTVAGSSSSTSRSASAPPDSADTVVGPAAQARSTADALRRLTRRVPGASLPEEDDSLRRPTSMSTTRNPLGLSGALSQYLSVTVEGRPEKEHNVR